MNWLRQGLLELWAMVVVAGIMGFLGPFGTYLEADFPERVWNWWTHLMGAYVLVRPSIVIWTAIANATFLPKRQLVFWGVVVSSLPLAGVWSWAASVFFHALGGFPGIVPFALLSALGVLGVVWWAQRANDHLRAHSVPLPIDEPASETRVDSSTRTANERSGAMEPDDRGTSVAESRPRLLDRLPPQFGDRVLALQSEDHYVRVHGDETSELLLMRLRDAIAEMDTVPGEQVHRSWWVARNAIASIECDGRKRELHLVNGQRAPVARDSAARLQRLDFLPDGKLSPL